MNRHLNRCQPARATAYFIGVLTVSLSASLIAKPLLSQTLLSQDNTPASQTPASPADTERPTLSLGSQGAAVSELQSVLKLLGYYKGTVDGQYQASTAEAVSAFQQAVRLQPDGVVGTETWNRLLPSAPPIQQTAAAPATTPAPAATPTPATASAPTATPAPAATPSPPSPSFPAPTAATPAPSPAPTPGPASGLAPAPVSPTPSYTPIAPAQSPTPTSPAPSQTASPSPSPAPSPAPASTSPDENPVLRVGMTGEAVTRLQERLKAVGVYTGTVDGVFGAETEAAVQAAQRNYNLEPDGIVGPATWEALKP